MLHLFSVIFETILHNYVVSLHLILLHVFLPCYSKVKHYFNDYIVLFNDYLILIYIGYFLLLLLIIL